jgi:DNA-binding MarR family transcriptional regulator
MSGTVSALAAHGWVDKQPNPEDARGSVVTLTDSGRRELDRVRRRNGDLVAERLTSHSVEDLATAVAVLRDVLGSGPDTEKGTL